MSHSPMKEVSSSCVLAVDGVDDIYSVADVDVDDCDDDDVDIGVLSSGNGGNGACEFTSSAADSNFFDDSFEAVAAGLLHLLSILRLGC